MQVDTNTHNVTCLCDTHGHISYATQLDPSEQKVTFPLGAPQVSLLSYSKCLDGNYSTMGVWNCNVSSYSHLPLPNWMITWKCGRSRCFYFLSIKNVLTISNTATVVMWNRLLQFTSSWCWGLMWSMLSILPVVNISLRNIPLYSHTRCPHVCIFYVSIPLLALSVDNWGMQA